MNKIFFIRNEKVWSDSDLAELYGVETRSLNEEAEHNIDRFPEDFMFQLTETEFDNLKLQIATSSWSSSCTLPYASTGHVIFKLSSVFSSDLAI
jgi:hypothetical protein